MSTSAGACRWADLRWECLTDVRLRNGSTGHRAGSPDWGARRTAAGDPARHPDRAGLHLAARRAAAVSELHVHARVPREVIEPTAQGQPAFISEPILTFAHFYGHDLALWNTLSAEIQCAIGLGLIVSRRSVRPALLVSFFWAFVVWWLGEGFGTIFSGTPVSPLMGAPGAVLLYGLIGLLRLAAGRAPTAAPVDGGLLGRRGGRVVWSAALARGGGAVAAPRRPLAGTRSTTRSPGMAERRAALAGERAALGRQRRAGARRHDRDGAGHRLDR